MVGLFCLQVPPESLESYYTRNFFVTQCVLQKTEEIGGNLLFVGHAATLDACSRQLLDKEQVRLKFDLYKTTLMPPVGVRSVAA